MKNLKNSKKEQGFTIIEVLIVLAIAGLIILIVFLAVPALQRNSRNTQAKNEASSILGALSEFVNNNNGKLPANGTGDAGGTNDASNVFKNTKLSNTTSITVQPYASTTAPTSTMSVLRIGGKCNAPTGNSSTAQGSGRQVALLYMIENSSGDLVACQES